MIVPVGKHQGLRAAGLRLESRGESRSFSWSRKVGGSRRNSCPSSRPARRGTSPLTRGVVSPVPPIRPSTGWLRPTHPGEGFLLYSVLT